MSKTWPIKVEPRGFAPSELTIGPEDPVLVLIWNGALPLRVTFLDPKPSRMPTLDKAPFYVSQCACNSKNSPFSSPGMDFTDVPEGTYEIEADDGGVAKMTGKLTVTKPGGSR